jgi:lipopolysaccharide/colanic/teichoic acid biosynthesis glycosyltransferase
MDITVASALLVLLSPLLALIALSIWISMGRPALFRQTRAGYRGKPFQVLKFRTLTEACDSEGNLLADIDRMTPLGNLFRRSSLDELPQMWNVIRGEMSLVGPRPLLVEYLQKYTPEQARRHDVKPGLTGWAQLHGRQGLLFSTRLEMDVWYVDHWSLLLDLKLILRTLLQLRKLSAAGATLDADKTDDLGLFALIQKRKKDGNQVSLL